MGQPNASPPLNNYNPFCFSFWTLGFLMSLHPTAPRTPHFSPTPKIYQFSKGFHSYVINLSYKQIKLLVIGGRWVGGTLTMGEGDHSAQPTNKADFQADFIIITQTRACVSTNTQTCLARTEKRQYWKTHTHTEKMIQIGSHTHTHTVTYIRIVA